jgi:hypothetical protein
MYRLGSLTAELQKTSRRLLDVFEVPHTKAAGDRRTQGMCNRLESIGCLTHMKSLTDISRLKVIRLHPNDRARPCIDEAEQDIRRRPRRRQRNCHMNNHILVFCDRQGNERFFLRRKATTPDIQRYSSVLRPLGGSRYSMGKTQVGAAFLTIMKYHWSAIVPATAAAARSA